MPFGNKDCLSTYSGVKVRGVAKTERKYRHSDGEESMGLVQDRILVGGSK